MPDPPTRGPGGNIGNMPGGIAPVTIPGGVTYDIGGVNTGLGWYEGAMGRARGLWRLDLGGSWSASLSAILFERDSKPRRLRISDMDMGAREGLRALLSSQSSKSFMCFGSILHVCMNAWRETVANISSVMARIFAKPDSAVQR